MAELEKLYKQQQIFLWVGLPILLYLYICTLSEAALSSEGVYLYAARISFFSTLLAATNYFLLIPLLWNEKKFLSYTIAIVGTFCSLLLADFLIPQLSNPTWNWAFEVSPFLWYVMVAFLSGILAIVFNQSHRKSKMLTQKYEKLEKELDFLKMQINPHFLFNTLNNIYSLAFVKDDRTAPMIIRLSELLRYMLYDCSENRVRLEKEIEFLKGYIDLQKLKDSKDINVDFYTEGIHYRDYIAPLILINFLENAFRHSNIYSSEDSWIQVDMIKEEDNMLQISISNSIKESTLPLKIGESPKYKEGLGIKNAKRQLELFYPNKHKLEFIHSPNSFTVNIKLDISSE